MEAAYHGDHAAGTDAVAHGHSHQALVVGVLAPPHQHLVAHEVGALVDHEAAALHPAGVAPAQVGGQLGTVAAGLIGATLEVPVLVEDDLETKLLFKLNVKIHTICHLISFVILNDTMKTRPLTLPMLLLGPAPDRSGSCQPACHFYTHHDAKCPMEPLS